MLGQDGAFGDDGRFVAIPPRQNFPCAGTDRHGNLFLSVFMQDVPASATIGMSSGCAPAQPSDESLSRLPQEGRRLPACPARDLRNVAFGVLGPDAVAVTYTLNGHAITEPTGPGGAYVAVVPGTATFCTVVGRGGRMCMSGGGESTTATLQAGVIASVRYAGGQVCRLAAPESFTGSSGVRAGGAPGVVSAPGTGTVPAVVTGPYGGTPDGDVASSCPDLEYAPTPYRVRHVTPAQVAAPMTVRTYAAKRYCYKPLAFGAFQIQCDERIPPGYRPDTPGASPSIALVDISFTARLAADNRHSVYEFSYGRVSGPTSCAANTGGTDATTMLPVRAGQRVTIQDDRELCPGAYAGLVTYQPDGGPGDDTLDFSRPIGDGSILVGRFRYVLRRQEPARRGRGRGRGQKP
jgi:hypothetical protein